MEITDGNSFPVGDLNFLVVGGGAEEDERVDLLIAANKPPLIDEVECGTARRSFCCR